MEKKYVVGIDIGAQSAKIGIVDRLGKVLRQKAIVSNQTTEFEVFLNEMVDAVHELLRFENIHIEEIKGIGVGAPNGNFYTGKIEYAPNLTWGGDKSIDFNAEMEAKIGVRCVLTNDANATAMGEMQYGAAKGMKDFIEITLGTGVGSGIVVNGEVLYGHDGFAGELGHTSVVRGENGRICGCGRKGCLEAYASAIGLARTAREILENTAEKSLLREIPIDTISSKDVALAAERGDELAKRIYNQTGRILGESLADFVAFSAPEAIILFGGMTQAGDLIMNPVKEAFEEKVLKMWKNKINIIFSGLPASDAAILGASALAW
jgi:glucokinase